jgi:hypothetical protein
LNVSVGGAGVGFVYSVMGAVINDLIWSNVERLVVSRHEYFVPRLDVGDAISVGQDAGCHQ